MIRSGKLVKQMISQARKSINHGKTTDYVAIILYEARMKAAKVQGSCYLCFGKWSLRHWKRLLSLILTNGYNLPRKNRSLYRFSMSFTSSVVSMANSFSRALLESSPLFCSRKRMSNATMLSGIWNTSSR